MTKFDVIIIGSGPTSVSALKSLPKNNQVAIISGKNSNSINFKKGIHPKILARSFEINESIGLTDPMPINGYKNKFIFNTSAIGGLANYWGQQFYYCGINDPWPEYIFNDYSDYKKEVDEIESLFNIQKYIPKHKNNYSISQPRLVLGSDDCREAGLNTIKLLYNKLKNNFNYKEYKQLARTFKIRYKICEVTLDDGTKIACDRLIIAAGVIGTANLLKRSFPEINSAKFNDYHPWRLYTINIAQKLWQRHEQAQHFNMTAIEKINDNKCNLFASIYNLNEFEFNLATAILFNKTFRSLKQKKIKLIKILCGNRINPIQVWTEKCKDELEIIFNTNSVKINRQEFNEDYELSNFIKFLRHNNIIKFAKSQTIPGYGYHYHNLNIKIDDKYYSVYNFLKQKTDNRVLCIDASVMNKCALVPPTLTTMAIASNKIKKEFN